MPTRGEPPGASYSAPSVIADFAADIAVGRVHRSSGRWEFTLHSGVNLNYFSSSTEFPAADGETQHGRDRQALSASKLISPGCRYRPIPADHACNNSSAAAPTPISVHSQQTQSSRHRSLGRIHHERRDHHRDCAPTRRGTSISTDTDSEQYIPTRSETMVNGTGITIIVPLPTDAD